MPGRRWPLQRSVLRCCSPVHFFGRRPLLSDPSAPERDPLRFSRDDDSARQTGLVGRRTTASYHTQVMIEVRTKRLTSGDREIAGKLFVMMAEAFGEAHEPLTAGYLDSLLNKGDFWAIAAFQGTDIIGGLTAHTLPMTRANSSEIFIYDIAVRESHRRRGVGRRLVMALRESARAIGIRDIFVPADNDDKHALDFYRALGGAPSAVTFFTFSDHEK